MKTVSINLYSFSELSNEAKDNAINNHMNFLDSTPIEGEDENGNLEDYYHEHNREEVIESIKINDYLFFYNGDMAHCTTYTGKHEKAGITEFHFHGQTFRMEQDKPFEIVAHEKKYYPEGLE